MISKLKKLKGRSFSELTERGRQKARIMRERAGFSRDLRLPGDEEFLALFNGSFEKSGQGIHDYFLKRKPAFYPSFDRLDLTVEALKTQFPNEVDSLARQADQILSGEFHLLGCEELNFGGPVPDWHFDPVSGRRPEVRHWSLFNETDAAETGDKRVIWELNRHQYLTLFGRLYSISKDERLTQAFVTHVTDWIDKNPPKMGVNWISSLEVAYRSISWIWAIHFFISSDKVMPGFFLQILKCLYLNGRHLARHLSLYSSPNTHLTGEALGLYIIGMFLSEISEAAKWKETGYRILMAALDYQVREDGGYVEQAIHYHRYTADIYLSLYILRRAEGIRIESKHDEKLRSLLKFLMHLTGPNGEVPSIGDDDGGRLHFLEDSRYADCRSTLAAGSAVLEDPELKFVSGGAGPELLWLTGTDGLESYDDVIAREPETRNIGFNSSGYFTARSGWGADDSFVLIDCGPHGFVNGGHAHADALSFVLTMNGMPVLIDPGTFCYTADTKLRDHFRSTPAHNCLVVDGHSSSEPDGPFSWKTQASSEVLEWREANADSIFRGKHNGFESRGVKYEREIIFSGGGLTCTDYIESPDEHRYEISFILDPSVRANVRRDSEVEIASKDGNRPLLIIDTKLISDGTIESSGWSSGLMRISPRYGNLSDSTRIVFSFIGSGKVQAVNAVRSISI